MLFQEEDQEDLSLTLLLYNIVCTSLFSHVSPVFLLRFVCSLSRFNSRLMMETRADVQIPLLELPPLNDLSGSRLPTRVDVFRHFWHLRKVQGQTIAQAENSAAKAVMECWKSVGLVPKTRINICKDIKAIVSSYQVSSSR